MILVRNLGGQKEKRQLFCAKRKVTDELLNLSSFSCFSPAFLQLPFLFPYFKNLTSNSRKDCLAFGPKEFTNPYSKTFTKLPCVMLNSYLSYSFIVRFMPAFIYMYQLLSNTQEARKENSSSVHLFRI